MDVTIRDQDASPPSCPPTANGEPAQSEAELEQERLAAKELARITPPNDELLKLARKLQPPASWFEGHEEKPW